MSCLSFIKFHTTILMRKKFVKRQYNNSFQKQFRLNQYLLKFQYKNQGAPTMPNTTGNRFEMDIADALLSPEYRCEYYS